MIMIIACIISFVVGAILMMCAIGMVAIQKDKKPQNKVRFFIGKVESDKFVLLLRDRLDAPVIAEGRDFIKYGINIANFADMKDDEIREVFLNLED